MAQVPTASVSSGDLPEMQTFGTHLRSIDQILNFDTIPRWFLGTSKFVQHQSCGSHSVIQGTCRSLKFLKWIWEVKTISILILRLYFLHSFSHTSIQVYSGVFQKPSGLWVQNPSDGCWNVRSCILKFCFNLWYNKYNSITHIIVFKCVEGSWHQKVWGLKLLIFLSLGRECWLCISGFQLWAELAVGAWLPSVQWRPPISSLRVRGLLLGLLILLHELPFFNSCLDTEP